MGGAVLVYLLLLAAILVEVVAAVATRVSEGFTRPVPVLVAAVGVLTAYYLLSQVLQRGMALGVAYAIWSAVGIALVAGAGVVLGDRLTAVQVLGMALVVGGVVSLEVGG
ncbi:MAG: multidrug efflux SMR transporter [Pseudonocardia sp.]